MPTSPMRAETVEGSAEGEPSRMTLAGLKARCRMWCECNSRRPKHAWYSMSKRCCPARGLCRHLSRHMSASSKEPNRPYSYTTALTPCVNSSSSCMPTRPWACVICGGWSGWSLASWLALCRSLLLPRCVCVWVFVFVCVYTCVCARIICLYQFVCIHVYVHVHTYRHT